MLQLVGGALIIILQAHVHPAVTLANAHDAPGGPLAATGSAQAARAWLNVVRRELPDEITEVHDAVRDHGSLAAIQPIGGDGTRIEESIEHLPRRA